MKGKFELKSQGIKATREREKFRGKKYNREEKVWESSDAWGNRGRRDSRKKKQEI